MLDNLMLLEMTITLVVLLSSLVAIRLMTALEERQKLKCSDCKKSIKFLEQMTVKHNRAKSKTRRK